MNPQRYTSPPDRAAYNARVWDIVRQIPPGKVATYGQIASMVITAQAAGTGDPIPAAYHAWGARWVGGAMAACPADVPWQRVINSQGKISLRKGKGSTEQRCLLEAEGVEFDAHDRVDLRIYAWLPSPQDLSSKRIHLLSD
ncbi:MAG: MGMT family protein [Anaerolineales bacterium]|nr:MGMT family protein [Anaerolineales bacterium]